MNRLRELRLNAGISQATLATAAETTQRNISYWESGRIELNLYAAIRLAQIFQVDVEYLAGYSDDLGIKPDIKLQIDRISSEERKLVGDYRDLTPAGKRLVNETIKTLLTTSGGSEKKKNKM